VVRIDTNKIVEKKEHGWLEDKNSKNWIMLWRDGWRLIIQLKFLLNN